ncbi:MAG: hypothetical protein FWH17_02520 [Oscillospiraceae bacterium]|nr:hypothetical protein [Oscillospiraceae bacterium]
MWDFIKSIFTGDAFDYLIGIIWPFIQSILETIFLAILLVPIYLIKIVQYVVGIFAGTRDIQVKTDTWVEVDFSNVYDPIRNAQRAIEEATGTGLGLRTPTVMMQQTENTTFLEYFFNQPFITRAFWGITLIALALCIGFSIVAVIRSMGDLQQNRPLGKVIGSMGKAMLTFLLVPFMCISAIWLVTVVMRQTEELFSSAAIYGEEVSVEGALLVSSLQPHHVRMWDAVEKYELVDLPKEVDLSFDGMSLRAYGHYGAPAQAVEYYKSDPVISAAFEALFADPRFEIMKNFYRRNHFYSELDEMMPDDWMYFNNPGELAIGVDGYFAEAFERRLDSTAVETLNVLEMQANIDEGLLRVGTRDNPESHILKKAGDRGLAFKEANAQGDMPIIWTYSQIARELAEMIAPNVPLAEDREERFRVIALSEIALMEADAQTAVANAASALVVYEATLAAYNEWLLENPSPGFWGYDDETNPNRAREQADLLTAYRNAETTYNDAQLEADTAKFIVDYGKSRLGVESEYAGDYDMARVHIRGRSIANEKYEGLANYNDARSAAEWWRILSDTAEEFVASADALMWYNEKYFGRGVRLVNGWDVAENYSEAAQRMRYNELVEDYMFGRKGVDFRDMPQIRRDFNVFNMFFGGVGLFSIVAAWFMVIMLLRIVLIFIRRIFEVIVLYIVSPFFVSVIPLDDGKRFDGWRDMFISRLLAGFGSIFTLNVFLLMLPMIWNPDLSLSDNTFIDSLLKLIFMAGGIYTVWKSHTLISQIINPQGAASEQESAGGVLAIGSMALGAGASMAMGGAAGTMNSLGSGSGGGSGGSGGSGSSGGSGGSSGNKNPTLDGSSIPALPPSKPPPKP